MRFLVIIPAREGSKGIPQKNIKPLKGKPLIYYTIESARELFDDNDICVSTDSEVIKKIVERTNLEVPFIRPLKFAKDTSSMHEVLLHALDYYEKANRIYDALVLLQPTSPLREARHIKEAINLYNSDLDMVVSVKETKSNPYYILFEENKDGLLEKSKKGDFVRRQDCPKVWEYNGSIYVINVNSIKKNPRNKLNKVKKYVMDEISSIDIDTKIDWMNVENILKFKK